MAKTSFNVLGRQSGKLGEIVGMVRNGHQLYRGYTRKVRVSNTLASQRVRARFRQLIALTRAFKAASRLGFSMSLGDTLRNTSNVFTMRNKGVVTATTPTSVTVDYGAIVVSEGSCPWVEFGTPSFVEEAEVTVTFQTSSDMPGVSVDDQVYLFVYQPDSNLGVLSIPVARSTGSCTVAVPEIWSGMKVHVYGFAVSAGATDGTVPAGTPSPSFYIGNGTVA